jgi:hypothetical protein
MRTASTHRFVLTIAVVSVGVAATIVPNAGAATASKWSRVASLKVSARSTALQDVECLKVDDCIAVGSLGTDAAHSKTLVARWDGSGWVKVASPTPARGGGLNGISCVSATFCMTVGVDAFGAAPFAQRWNGKRWSAVPFAKPPLPAQSLTLPLRVSCASTTDCMAVGFEERQTDGVSLAFAEHWEGAKFSVVPTNAGSGEWFAVDCPAAQRCVAVGATPSLLPQRASAAVWNGTRWRQVGVPMPPGAKRSVLYGVSCPGATACVATGEWAKSKNPTAASFALTARWDGAHWRRIASPKPAVHRAPLFDVSCPSATACMAVGEGWTSVNHSQAIVPISEELTGAKFAAVATPRPPGYGNVLNAVSCTDATHCLAVGTSSTGSETGQMIAEAFAP